MMKICAAIILYFIILTSASGAEVIKSKCFNIDRSNKLWHKPDSIPSDVEVHNSSNIISISSYPNPANDAIIFEVNGLESILANCRIDDLSGKNVYDFGQINLSDNRIYWNLIGSNSTKISSGIYYLNIFNSYFKHSYKFIVN